jgi:hypothetical protein
MLAGSSSSPLYVRLVSPILSPLSWPVSTSSRISISLPLGFRSFCLIPTRTRLRLLILRLFLLVLALTLLVFIVFHSSLDSSLPSSATYSCALPGCFLSYVRVPNRRDDAFPSSERQNQVHSRPLLQPDSLQWSLPVESPQVQDMFIRFHPSNHLNQPFVRLDLSVSLDPQHDLKSTSFHNLSIIPTLFVYINPPIDASAANQPDDNSNGFVVNAFYQKFNFLEAPEQLQSLLKQHPPDAFHTYSSVFAGNNLSFPVPSQISRFHYCLLWIQIKVFSSSSESVSVRVHNPIISGPRSFVSGLMFARVSVPCSAASSLAISSHSDYLSAVFLNWNHPLNVLSQSLYIYSHFSFVNEINLWNNNFESPLVLLDFLLYHALFLHKPLDIHRLTNTIKVYNTGENTHDFAKWLVCSAFSSNSRCLFLDDDWAPCPIPALYANSLRFPALIHSVTMPSIWLEHRRWFVHNREINLHAQFSWLGAGSIVPRVMARKFLQQLGRMDFQFNRDNFLVCDMLFSLFSNDYPYKFMSQLVPMPRAEGAADMRVGWSDQSPNHWDLLFHSLNRAAQMMFNTLNDQLEAQRMNGSAIFNTAERLPAFDEREGRAICKDRNCILITNLHLFTPLINTRRIFDYNPFDFAGGIQALQSQYNEGDWSWWDSFSYSSAVDGNAATIWKIEESHIHKNPGILAFQSQIQFNSVMKALADFPPNHSLDPSAEQPFYFGLDLLQTLRCSRIILTNTSILQQSYVTIVVSLDSHQWQLVEFTTQQVNENSLHFSFADQQQELRYFRIRTVLESFPFYLGEVRAECSNSTVHHQPHTAELIARFPAVASQYVVAILLSLTLYLT